MARTIKDIQASIVSAIQADPVLSARFTSTSATAIWNLITYTVAFCASVLEQLFDLFTIETNEVVSRDKSHSIRWYAEKTKSFQYGYTLPIDTDEYNNTGLTQTQIDASKIVAYAAAVRQRHANGILFLRIKVAKLINGDLGPLTAPELSALDTYIFRIEDAGVDYEVTSSVPDKLVQAWTIYYDPLLLDGNGDRIDGSIQQPVFNGIKDYLLNLPFNGEYRTTYHQDYVQAIPGVVDAKLTLCQVAYGSLALSTVAVSYIPDAGYMRFYANTDLQIQYIPLSPIK